MAISRESTTGISDAASLFVSVGHLVIERREPPQELVRLLRSRGRFNRLGREDWRPICAQMPVGMLGELLLGLTWCEAHFRWIGGSAASAIWVYEILLKRDLERTFLDELTSLIVSLRYNPYVPFGGLAFSDARTYSEYLLIESARQSAAERYKHEERARCDRAAGERAIRRKQRQRSARDRETPVRVELLALLRGLSPARQLERLAADEIYAATFYPTALADAADMMVIQSLAPSVRHALRLKLKGKHRGPWSSFKKRLYAVSPALQCEAGFWRRSADLLEFFQRDFNIGPDRIVRAHRQRKPPLRTD